MKTIKSAQAVSGNGSCENCEFHAYVCGDNFCKHPNLPEIAPGTPWPWLHYPFNIPDWCPLNKKANIEANKKLDKGLNKAKKIQEDIRIRWEDGY